MFKTLCIKWYTQDQKYAIRYIECDAETKMQREKNQTMRCIEGDLKYKSTKVCII